MPDKIADLQLPAWRRTVELTRRLAPVAALVFVGPGRHSAGRSRRARAEFPFPLGRNGPRLAALVHLAELPGRQGAAGAARPGGPGRGRLAAAGGRRAARFSRFGAMAAARLLALAGSQGSYAGVRHALPALMALAILAGAVVSLAWRRRSRAWGGVVVGLLALAAAMTLAEPRLWEYHNELAGGTAEGVAPLPQRRHRSRPAGARAAAFRPRGDGAHRQKGLFRLLVRRGGGAGPRNEFRAAGDRHRRRQRRGDLRGIFHLQRGVAAAPAGFRLGSGKGARRPREDRPLRRGRGLARPPGVAALARPIRCAASCSNTSTRRRATTGHWWPGGSPRCSRSTPMTFQSPSSWATPTSGKECGKKPWPPTASPFPSKAATCSTRSPAKPSKSGSPPSKAARRRRAWRRCAIPGWSGICRRPAADVQAVRLRGRGRHSRPQGASHEDAASAAAMPRWQCHALAAAAAAAESAQGEDGDEGERCVRSEADPQAVPGKASAGCSIRQDAFRGISKAPARARCSSAMRRGQGLGSLRGDRQGPGQAARQKRQLRWCIGA